MLTANLLAKKRDGHELADDEIRFLIEGFCRGEVTDDQMAALAMAVCIRGMRPEEVTALTQAMLASGERLPRVSDRPRIDKHSTGGLGDKVSLVLAPLLAACGAEVPMVSGRGLGRTGGTLDKLESIPGFRCDLTLEESSAALREAGALIVGASEQIAPADRRLYAIRDVTGTVESIPLITASILSKKLAASLDALVMDVKVGSAAFMKTMSQARELAESLTGVGDQAGLPTIALVTDMDQPLGQAVGNAIEVNEAVDVLRNEGPGEVRELCVALAAELLHRVELADSIEQARRQADQTLRSGEAMECFERMVHVQGGKLAGRLPLAPPTEIASDGEGYVASFDCGVIADAVISAGGGRRRAGEPIDPSVGICAHVRIGDRVELGQPLLTFHHHDSESSEYLDGLSKAVRLSPHPVDPRPVILQRFPPALRGREGIPRAPETLRSLERLVRSAFAARDRAYVPHSQFRVGAALLLDDDQLVTGCNVENASFSLTICAERVAAAAAVAGGYRSWRALAIASVGGVMPCGACRQFLAEFGETEIIGVDVTDGSRRHRWLSELLPDAFSASDLPGAE